MIVSKKFDFEGAHWLPRHPGKCRHLHGHSYIVEVKIEGPLDKSSQFVMDYADLKAIVQPTIDLWDHKLLNAFIRYSSAENMAAHLAHIVRAKLPNDTINRLTVAVSETRKTWAVWDSAVREDVLMLDNAGEDAEWRSPDVPIPILDPPVFEATIKEYDQHIEEMLVSLTNSMVEREQYVLYRASLSDPQLPLLLQKGKVQ